MANIYQNLIDSYSFPNTVAGRTSSRARQQIDRQPSVSLTTANTSVNENTSIAKFGGTATGGNFTLTVNATVPEITYTTANIAHNASAATIEAALDLASPVAVGNGDVGVTAGATDFTDGAVVFDCTGNLANIPVLITITNVNLSGTAPTVGAVTRTVDGHADRNVYQALYELNIVNGAGNDAGESPSMTLPTKPNDYIGQPDRARLELIDWLASQIVLEEGTNNTRNLIRTLYGLPESLYGPH